MATKHYCVHGGDDYLQASLNEVGSSRSMMIGKRGKRQSHNCK